MKIPPDLQSIFTGVAKAWNLEINAAVKIRKVWRLETTRGSFCLKRSILEPGELLFVQSAIDYLWSRDFQAVLTYIPTIRGVGSAEIDGGSYLLCKWLESREADFDHLEDLALAARVLAEMHNRSAGFIPYRSDADRVRWGLWPQILTSRLWQLAEFGQRAVAMTRSSAFCARFAHHFPYYYAQAHTALTALLESPYESLTADGVAARTICHHDFSARNLLISEGGEPFLVDFDYCLADLRLHDLANFILRLLRHDHWRPETALTALTHYQRHNPLDERELAVLYPFLLWPQDFWQLGLQYFLEELPWSAERFLQTLRRKTEERDAREAFLDWYRREFWCGRKTLALFPAPERTM